MRDIVVHSYETIDKLILWNVADTEIEKIKEKIKPVAPKYNLTYVWIFGSYVRKKQRPDSDSDILIKIEDVADGFKIVKVKFALEEALQKEVDIITTGSIISFFCTF